MLSVFLPVFEIFLNPEIINAVFILFFFIHIFIVRSSFVLYNANHTDAPSPLLLLPSPPINRCLHTIPLNPVSVS